MLRVLYDTSTTNHDLLIQDERDWLVLIELDVDGNAASETSRQSAAGLAAGLRYSS